jgi:hypothetical protein
MNSISYKNSLFKYTRDVLKLRAFMFTKENKETIINNSEFEAKKAGLDEEHENESEYRIVDVDDLLNMDGMKETPKETLVNDTDKHVTDEKELISPRHQDTLFWCLFIIHFGYKEYLQVDRNYGVKELEEKQKIYEFIKNNPTKAKETNYKVTNVAIQEMLSELMTPQKQTSMLSLIGLIAYYHVNVLIINEETKCMLEFWANSEMTTDTLTYILYKSSDGKYKLQFENIAEYKVNELRNKYMVLEHYSKYMKSVSGYKVEELEAMAQKLNIFDDTKKYKKSELYENIGKVLAI